MAKLYTCSRCGGSGRYSFNLIHGTRCYGCGGTGKQKTKPAKPTPRWAVFGQDRSTGEFVRLYNTRAKTEEGAIERARSACANASAAWKDTYSLTSARAIKWTDMTTADALTWDDATAEKEEASQAALNEAEGKTP